jgi:transcriptional regulator with XRE-family HTH domain
MVGGEAALEIRVLHRHGKGIREIARQMGNSRNTVRRYLRDESAARYKPRPPRATKLDLFKDYVVERLTSAAPERIPASVLLRELRERGYTGGYTMLKGLVAALKPKEAAAPIVRFETAPGEQMQVDWAVIRRGSNRLSVFCRDLGVEPRRLCRVCHRRAGRNADRGARERVSGVRRDTARGAVRQYAHGRAAATRLRPRPTPLSSGVSRLCPALQLPAAPVCAVSGADQGQSGALHPLFAQELLGSASGMPPATPG